MVRRGTSKETAQKLTAKEATANLNPPVTSVERKATSNATAHQVMPVMPVMPQ